MEKANKMANNVIYMMLQGMRTFDSPTDLFHLEDKTTNLGFVECVLPSFQEDLRDAIAQGDQEFIDFVRESMIYELKEGTYFRQPLSFYLANIDYWFDGYDESIPFIKEVFTEAYNIYKEGLQDESK